VEEGRGGSLSRSDYSSSSPDLLCVVQVSLAAFEVSMAGEAVGAVELGGEPSRSWIKQSSGARERVPVIVGQLGVRVHVHSQRSSECLSAVGRIQLVSESRQSSSSLVRVDAQGLLRTRA
jgi:hypothetical protein